VSFITIFGALSFPIISTCTVTNGNVTSVGWQVTLRDPKWHSGVAMLHRELIHPYTLLLLYFILLDQSQRNLQH